MKSLDTFRNIGGRIMGRLKKLKGHPLLDAAKSRLQAAWARFSALSEREKKITLAAAAILAVFLVDFAIVRPIRGRIRGVNERIVVEERKAIHNMRVAAQKPAVEAVYQNMMRGLEKPPAEDEEVRAAMLRDIESQARANELNLSEVKPLVSSESGYLREYSVRLQADGRMDQIAKFFVQMVEMRRLYYVKSFRIIAHPDDVNKVRAAATINRAVLID